MLSKKAATADCAGPGSVHGRRVGKAKHHVVVEVVGEAGGVACVDGREQPGKPLRSGHGDLPVALPMSC